jgi:hypothetical protein
MVKTPKPIAKLIKIAYKELINVLAGRDESGDTLPKKPIFCDSLANFFNLEEMTKLSNHVGKKKLKTR